METQVISTSSPDAIPRAIAVLKSGGLVAFPTDTVYGLGALAFDAEAVRSIYTVKGRSEEKGIPVLIADPLDLEKVALEVSEIAAALAAHFWPGPLTLVLPKHPNLPDIIASTATIGVRIPDHPVARMLLQAAGPLAVSSANRSGQHNSSTAQEVLIQMRGQFALILDGGRAMGGIPSTVVDCVGAEPKILREGPILKTEIWKVLGYEL
jgi:L-threonylcarbamoyladenylate synthase